MRDGVTWAAVSLPTAIIMVVDSWTRSMRAPEEPRRMSGGGTLAVQGFMCAFCDRPIAHNSEVFMAHDEKYCSVKCRTVALFEYECQIAEAPAQNEKTVHGGMFAAFMASMR